MRAFLEWCFSYSLQTGRPFLNTLLADGAPHSSCSSLGLGCGAELQELAAPVAALPRAPPFMFVEQVQSSSMLRLCPL